MQPGLSRTSPWAVPLALVAVYLIWGSTYLGIAFAVQTIPPFMLGAVRFLLAGGLLYAVLRRQGLPHPTPQQWWGAARVGVLLFVGGMAPVVVAQQAGVASGLAATVIATMPLWAALFSGFWGRWPASVEWVGLGLGLVGVLLLSLDKGFAGAPWAAALVFVGPVFWAFGSIWSRRLQQPPGLMAPASQMLVAGLVFLPLSFLFGETWQMPSPTSLWALAYLIGFGTLVGYNAYVFLLQNVSSSLATSYAFVNPVVAVILGAWLANERLSPLSLVALPVILLGVGLVVMAQRFNAATNSAPPRDG